MQAEQSRDAEGDALTPEEIGELVERFHRDGYAPVRGVLTGEEVAALREAADAIFADPEQKEKHRHGFDFVIARLYEGPEIFQNLITRQPILGLVEAILGARCGVVGENVIRNPPSVAISNWHVDDLLEFPLPPEVPRHDARMRMPVLWLSVQIALTDIESLEYGPTQFVPGSHYAGHHPPANTEAPTFEGHGVESVFCKAGDIYLQNHQCWHRGAPNLSQQTRYVLQIQYGRRWAINRFTGIS